jgi:hypothetical protein
MKVMSAPTPRTDARIWPYMTFDENELVPAYFARTLERELAALSTERDQFRAEVERLTKQIENLLKPMRDQAIARSVSTQSIPSFSARSTSAAIST